MENVFVKCKSIAVLLVAGLALPMSYAENKGPLVRRVFRPARVTRGNTNVVELQPIDRASWIWSAEDDVMSLEPRFLKFRNEFEVRTGDGKLVIDVSADERFYLACDGTFVARGPNRSTVENWQYNTYEIDLDPGCHVIEATVWRIGDKGPLAQLSWRGGFILKANGVYDNRLTTGIANWKVGKLEGIEPAGTDNGVWGTGSQWMITGSGVLSSDPSAWSDAKIVRGFAGKKGPTIFGGRTKGWMLFPSQIPDQTETVVRPGSFVAAADGALWRRRHDYTEADQNHALAGQLNELLSSEGRSVVVPAHRHVQIAWDLGRYYCGYPVLRMKGATGARVSWTWAEATQRGSDGLKGGEPGARGAIVGRYLSGYGDIFVCDGERECAFTTPWFRCGKWCRLDIETEDEPLELFDIHLIESRYPLEVESAFSSEDDISFRAIRAISARTMQMCCHEMLFDCPYYEQQMYPGDARVQLNVLSSLSRDDRMARRAIELYDIGTRDDGQCPFNWPTRGTQEGATYTLCYLLMYGDYVMNYGDRDWLKARLPGLRKSMAGMEFYENADGLLENLPGWQFVDWAVGWRSDGTAPGGRYGEGVNAEVNLFWSLAMQAAALVERALGHELQARYWDEKRLKLNETIARMFWCGEREILADTPAMKDFSEHAQCLALIGDVLPPEKSARMFRHLIEDEDLCRCTVYFSYYLFEAFFKMGRGDLFQKRLDLWRGYLEKGLTTTQEAPDIIQADGTLVESRSDCHAWGAHPIVWMQRGLAGIQSAAPFFEKVLVSPCPGTLRQITAKHPHPQGFIEVDLRFEDGQVTGAVRSPVPGEFVYEGCRASIAAGETLFIRH